MITQPVSGDGLREYLERHARGEADVNEPPMFVLQQHQTGDMHFNLRFEAVDDFPSWRLPDVAAGRTHSVEDVLWRDKGERCRGWGTQPLQAIAPAARFCEGH